MLADALPRALRLCISAAGLDLDADKVREDIVERRPGLNLHLKLGG